MRWLYTLPLPWLLLACPPSPQERPCNVDPDCPDMQRCVDGLCAPVGDGDLAGDGDGDGDGDLTGDGDGDGDMSGDGDGDGDGGMTGDGDGGALDGGRGDGGPVDGGVDDGGACIPLYADADEDGVGAGELLCGPPGGGPGWSALDSDCAPDDGTAWMWADLYLDGDEDGYTAGDPQPFCVGSTLPAGLHETPRSPPLTSFRPADGDEIDRNTSIFNQLEPWFSENGVRAPDGKAARSDVGDNATDFLWVNRLGLPPLPPDATVLGVRLTVARSLSGDADQGAVLDDGVFLVVAGEVVGEDRSREAPWGVSETVSYGGPEDAWGVSIPASEVGQNAFGVAIAARPEGEADDLEIEVDHMMVEVFVDQGEDCDDEDGAAWIERPTYVDQDMDRYPAADEGPGCYGASFPQGRADTRYTDEDDCYDFNDRAYPGSGTDRSSDRGDGSFDYDCDGVETVSPVTEATGCECQSFCTGIAETYTPMAACGDTVTVSGCSGSCSSSPTTCETTTFTQSVQCH